MLVGVLDGKLDGIAVGFGVCGVPQPPGGGVSCVAWEAKLESSNTGMKITKPM